LTLPPALREKRESRDAHRLAAPLHGKKQRVLACDGVDARQVSKRAYRAEEALGGDVARQLQRLLNEQRPHMRFADHVTADGLVKGWEWLADEVEAGYDETDRRTAGARQGEARRASAETGDATRASRTRSKGRRDG
jgi:hypothetical protein